MKFMKNFKVLFCLILSTSLSLLVACSSEIKSISEKHSKNEKTITCEDEDISETQTYVPETAGQYSACIPNPTKSVPSVPSVSIVQYRFMQSPTGHYNLSLEGECSEKNRPVTITITSGRSISTKPSCDSKGEWKISLGVTNFPIGPISITADHESATKIKAPQAQKTVSKLVPTVFISNHTVSSQISGSISLAGSCSEVNRPILLKLSNGIYNLVPPSPICKIHNYWTTIINITGLPLGTISVTADHETAGGTKATQAQYSFQRE